MQSAREVLSEVNGHTDVFWSKVKQMEVEVYNVNSIMAETSGDLKDVLKELFSTLNKVAIQFTTIVFLNHTFQGAERGFPCPEGYSGQYWAGGSKIELTGKSSSSGIISVSSILLHYCGL